eukprot:m.333770 g.333770  ORF g.333770 m.333770 type:complete len:178 (+) comp17219_c0_seq1:368-901(+)
MSNHINVSELSAEVFISSFFHLSLPTDNLRAHANNNKHLRHQANRTSNRRHAPQALPININHRVNHKSNNSWMSYPLDSSYGSTTSSVASSDDSGEYPRTPDTPSWLLEASGELTTTPSREKEAEKSWLMQSWHTPPSSPFGSPTASMNSEDAGLFRASRGSRFSEPSSLRKSVTNP